MSKKYALLTKTIITITLLLLIFIKIDFTEMRAICSNIDFPWLFIGIIFIFVQSWLSAVRWHYILKFVGIGQTFFYSLRIFWIGIFFNTCLPAGVGGDAIRIWTLRKNGASATIVFSSVFLDRLFGLLMLVLVIWASLPVVSRIIDNPNIMYFFHLALGATFIGFLSLTQLNRLPINWTRYRITRILSQISSDMRLISSSFLKLGLLSLIAILGLTMQILTVYILSLALSLHISIIDCFEFIPPVILLMTLPISIGGWGIRESAMITFFGYVGVSTTEALMLSILYGCVALLVTLPGAVIWLAWRNKIHLVDASLLDKIVPVFAKNQISPS